MKISLTGGDYQSRSVLASCQRRLNMYSEAVSKLQNEPVELVHYPTPGLTLLATTPNGYPIRGLYKASNGDLYCAANFDIYYIDKTWKFQFIGSLTKTTTLNPVKFADNGKHVILCDGTTVNGYSIDMIAKNQLHPLYDPSASDEFTSSSTGWLGSNFVDFSDTYLIANYIGTPTFYISNSEDVIFDPLQFGAKSAYADPLVGAVVTHRVIWLIGQLSTEVWYNSGGGSGISLTSGSTTTANSNNFPFEIMPGVSIDWGSAATYSIAKAEENIFWLAQNLNGDKVVLKGNGYNVQRISNHAIENVLSNYGDVSDCVGYCYMQQGHSFYVMNFPNADATWVFDLSSNMWHERCWLDNNGDEHMQRSTQHAFAYNKNVVNDWQNGNLYSLDLNAYTDNGQIIKRVVGFPRQVDMESDVRVVYKHLILEMDSGEDLIATDTPQFTLRWSDDKGKTWNNGLVQPLGTAGQYSALIKFTRLGVSRNRVFQVEWTSNGFVAISGAFVEVLKALT
jgi:hypothetical protein